jgi:hypothetical protein
MLYLRAPSSSPPNGRSAPMIRNRPRQRARCASGAHVRRTWTRPAPSSRSMLPEIEMSRFDAAPAAGVEPPQTSSSAMAARTGDEPLPERDEAKRKDLPRREYTRS